MKVGQIQTLKVNRISDYGLYLIDEEGQEVLLPNRFVSLDNKEGDEIEVFVYHDSEDRLVATTDKPLITEGVLAGKKYIVWLYVDNITGRCVATMKLKPYIDNDIITVKPQQQVDILIASESPIGYRAIINSRHWGML